MLCEELNRLKKGDLYLSRGTVKKLFTVSYLFYRQMRIGYANSHNTRAQSPKSNKHTAAILHVRLFFHPLLSYSIIFNLIHPQAIVESTDLGGKSGSDIGAVNALEVQ